MSVGHRSTLKAFHDHLIILRSDGSWEMSSLADEEPDTAVKKRRKAARR